MKTSILRAILALFLCVFLVNGARADQLQAVPLDQARKMAREIQAAPFAVSYVSQAEGQNAEIWRVRGVLVAPMDQTGELGEEFASLYEVHVWGERLFRSAQTFNPGDLRDDGEIMWENIAPDDEQKFSFGGIDGAYFYVPESPELARFRCLGKKLELPCDVKTEFIALSPEMAANLAAIQAPIEEFVLENPNPDEPMPAGNGAEETI